MEKGDVLVSKFGYDQTNAVFYLVVKATDKTVWLRELKGVEKYTKSLSGKALASPVFANDTILRRKIVDDFVMISSCEVARVWDFKPVDVTCYA